MHCTLNEKREFTYGSKHFRSFKNIHNLNVRVNQLYSISKLIVLARAGTSSLLEIMAHRTLDVGAAHFLLITPFSGGFPLPG